MHLSGNSCFFGDFAVVLWIGLSLLELEVPEYIEISIQPRNTKALTRRKKTTLAVETFFFTGRQQVIL